MKDEHITVSGKTYPVLHQFPVLHNGWEMDNDGWVVTDRGRPRLVMSTHGGKYFIMAAELVEKIAEYQKAMAETQEALALIGIEPKCPA